MMGTEIFKIDAPWAEELTKTRVSFLMNPTVSLNHVFVEDITDSICQDLLITMYLSRF